jgi:ketosteroid isomerase-like protein
MAQNTWRFVGITFIVLTLVFAALFGYYYMQYSSANINYNSLSSKYEAQRSAMVLGAALSHWNFISYENMQALINQYTSNATLNWVGGALNGVYKGKSAIQEVWNKFFNLWSAGWFSTLTSPLVSVNGNNATIKALVQFTVTPVKLPNQVQYLNINYTLNYIYDNNTWLIYYEEWRVAGFGFLSENQQSSLLNLALANAFSHWNAISIKNTTLVMQQYTTNATLFWIGGSLNGTYTGYNSIMDVWNKFFNIWAAIWFYSSSQPTVTINGNTVTVVAPIQFIVQRASNMSQFLFINVGYSITYQVTNFDASKGKYTMQIVSETFKVEKVGQLY